MKMLLLIAVLALAGCLPRAESNELVEVKVISVHQHDGGWNDPFTNSVVERTDTHERFYITAIYGKPGEVIKLRLTWSITHWD